MIGKNRIVPEKLILPTTELKVIDMDIYSDRVFVVLENQTVKEYYINDFYS